ncbi:MAG: glycosyltransferase [Planctomycetes bacterium]|nr:glycosyltransferase [Planctomycetota bacterium]MCC7396671.1 glycosyltransferase [Planctomycetota bacterium]
MKVAFVTWKFPALSNTFILNEIVEVLRRGCEVAIYSIGRSDDTVLHQDIKTYSLLERTFYLDDFRPPVRGEVGEMARYSADWLGDRVDALKPLAEHMRRTGVSVVHGCFANNSATVAMVAARHVGLPFTFECHAHDLFVDLRYADEKVAEARRVFSISEYNRQFLCADLRCAADKVVIRRVPILTEFCDSIDAGPRRPGLIVSVARLHAIKGYDVAISAFAKVVAAVPSARYAIIGEGELRPALEMQARRLGVADKVEFVGSMTNQDTLRLVRQATAFVLPSRIDEHGDRDGIPTSMIEAMYLRTPAVSTRVSGIPELVDDGVDGFLAEPEDVDTIAARLQQLLTDPGQRERMGEAARQKVLARFDVQKNIDVLLEHWRSICRGRRPEPTRGGLWGRLRRLLVR